MLSQSMQGGIVCSVGWKRRIFRKVFQVVDCEQVSIRSEEEAK